jgi:hypothetical protein
MKKTVYALGFLTLTTVTSCTDDAYDLKKENVDYSMQAGESSSILWTPDGNTSDAKLKDLFSVEEGQNLKFIKDPETGRDGLYCMWGEGDLETNITMSPGIAGWSDDIRVDEKTATVDLSNIPGFLRNEKTFFDIENPIILIKVNKTANVDFKSKIKMTNVKGGSETLSAITKNIEDFKIEGDCSDEDKAKKFYIAAQEVAAGELPEDYWDATWLALDESESTLQEMLREMPDQLKIELEAAQGKGAGTSELDVDYTFYAPMRPGARFRLNDVDATDGFKGDLKNLLFDAIVVQADALGDLPMTVRIVPVAINEKGDAMKDVIVTVNDKPFVDVPGNKVTSLFVKMSTISGEKTSHYVKRDYNYLDGIRFDFTVMNPATPGVKIFSDMKMRLEHMKLGVMGIGYDGN